jgi:hypothetical protein
MFIYKKCASNEASKVGFNGGRDMNVTLVGRFRCWR